MDVIITESQLKTLFKEDKNTTIKPGEEWFYEPQNLCLRSHNPPLKLDGMSATYIFSDGVTRITYEQSGKFYYVPKPQNPNAVRYNRTFLNKTGDWWCNSKTGKLERKVDEVIQQRKVDTFNDAQVSNSTLNSTIPQAKTMDDVKNKKGFVYRGMRGNVVKELQSMLLSLGYDLGEPKDDGIFGDTTKKAVEKFQKENGIVPKNNIYGIFGSLTYDKLLKVISDKD